MTPRLEIKICGLTRPGEAAAVAAAGADAIGIVFHAASPRHIEPDRAREIVDALPPGFPVVGVFAGTPAGDVARIAGQAGVRIVQLHGSETADTLAFLLDRGFHVIKTLKGTRPELLRAAQDLPNACGVLIECGQGPLPGGNGTAWNWAEAAPLAALLPFALAGGLTPENAAAAASAARASAVDVSSGVENVPGRKNLEKCARLVDTIRRTIVAWPVAPVFGADRPKGRPVCPDNR